MRKKLCVLLAGVLGAGALLAGCSNHSDVTVSVQSVSMITGYSSMGLYDRYAGIVEAGETVDIEKSDSMEVDEVLVKVGQSVNEGDVLFTYNTGAISLELDKMELELEQLKNTVSTKNTQIKTLEKEKTSAPSSEQLDYTLQIQTLQIDVKEAEYNITSKEKEIERSKAILQDSKVVSSVAGTVSAINTDNATDDYGNPKPFISITQAGDFRVKGTVNEQNVYSLQEGTPVIVRARVGEDSWTGTITLVDTEHPTTGNNNGMYNYGESDEMTSSSNYPFYITLDTDENLMLGQHVYIEPDLGQDEQEGFYLPANFIVDADGDAYVWAADDEDQLERRSVTLGNFDEELYSYEILDGLELSDYIAEPSEECEEGAAVEYYSEDSFNNEGDFMPTGGEIADDMGIEGDFGEEESFGEEEFVGEEQPVGIDGEVVEDTDGLIPADSTPADAGSAGTGDTAETQPGDGLTIVETSPVETSGSDGLGLIGDNATTETGDAG